MIKSLSLLFSAIFVLQDLKQIQDNFTIALKGYFGYSKQSHMHTMYLKTKLDSNNINVMPFASQSLLSFLELLPRLSGCRLFEGKSQRFSNS